MQGSGGDAIVFSIKYQYNNGGYNGTALNLGLFTNNSAFNSSFVAMVSGENGYGGNGGVFPIDDEEGYILLSFGPPRRLKGTIRKESFPDPINNPYTKLVEMEFVGFDQWQPNNYVSGPHARLYFEVDMHTNKIIPGSISGSVTGLSLSRTYSFNRILSMTDLPSSLWYKLGTRIRSIWSYTTTAGLLNVGTDHLWEFEYLVLPNGNFEVILTNVAPW